jgi:hypothetical protein
VASGHSSDRISTNIGIGDGTVSEIVKEIKLQEDGTEIDLLRETAVLLRRQGLDVNSFAGSIRLKEILNEIGLNEDQLESFIVPLNVYCFKRGLTPDEFISALTEISFLSDNLSIPVDQLPGHITRGKKLLEKLNQEIEDQRRLLETYNVTKDDLDEFRRSKPLLGSLKAKDRDLEKQKRHINYLERELIGEQTTRQYDWSISEHEPKLVNQNIQPPIEIKELKQLVNEMYHNPSKYADIIKMVRRRYYELQFRIER